MPFKEGRNRVTITQIEMIKLKEKDGDDNRFSIVITGQAQDGETMDGWLFVSAKEGKDGRTSFQRTMETLQEIGLPDNNLMNLKELVGKQCSFSCAREEDSDYSKGQLKVQFVNPVRESCSEEQIAQAMAYFTGGSIPQIQNPPQTQMPPPAFQPPVQNRSVSQ